MGILKKFEHFRIKMLCNSFKIKNYTINDDGTVDVQGNVNFNHSKIKKFPIKFGHVSGNFLAYDCILKTLEGAPSYVGGNFFVSNNTGLRSLKFSPLYVGGEYVCNYCGLETLEGIENTEVVEDFDFGGNDIYTLDHLPKLYKNLRMGLTPLINFGLGTFVNVPNFRDLWEAYDPVAKIGNDYVVYLDKLNMLRSDIFKSKYNDNTDLSQYYINRLSLKYKVITFDDIKKGYKL